MWVSSSLDYLTYISQGTTPLIKSSIEIQWKLTMDACRASNPALVPIIRTSWKKGNLWGVGECNCQNPTECPLPNQCTIPNILYEATIKSDLAGYGEKVYKGVSKPPFKLRFRNHKKSFNNIEYKTDTELSKEVWRIKGLGGTFNVSWRALGQFRDYNPANGKCGLCLSEKLAILEHSGPPLLNSRSEIISTCRHRLKYMLSSISDVT